MNKGKLLCLKDISVAHSFMAVSSHFPSLYIPQHLLPSTYVASLACGKTYGVAKDCTLCDVRVTDHAEAHRSAIFSGFNHIMGQCKGGSLCVVNLGFGNSGEQKPVQRTAMERLVSAVIVVVTSAGNVERDSCKGTFSASAAAIKVGNIDQKDKMVGSWGKCVTVFAPGTKVKGASIKSTTATALKTGTSSSTACKFLFMG